MFTRAALALALLTALPADAAQPDRPHPLAEAFAVCQGRFAAMQGDIRPVAGVAPDMAAAASQFADLLAAIGPLPGDPSPVAASLRRIRMQAQSEQARLLSVALFSADLRRAHRARLLVAERLRACATMLPG